MPGEFQKHILTKTASVETGQLKVHNTFYGGREWLPTITGIIGT